MDRTYDLAGISKESVIKVFLSASKYDGYGTQFCDVIWGCSRSANYHSFSIGNGGSKKWR